MNLFDFFNIKKDFVPFGGFNFVEASKNGNDIGGGKKKIRIELDGEIPLLDIGWEKIEAKKINNCGGGAQIDASKEKNLIDPKIREVLERLAQGRIFQKQRGDLEWDGRRMIKKIVNKQFGTIEEAKHSWKPKKVYFFVDTSGSVWYLADLIIKLLKSTCTSNTIRVFSGSEGHPNKDENENFILTKNRRTFLDEGMADLFNYEIPEYETVFIFWGDLQGVGIRPIELAQKLRKYKSYWLNPSDKIMPYCETKKMQKVSPVFMGMNNTVKIINQLKKII